MVRDGLSYRDAFDAAAAKRACVYPNVGFQLQSAPAYAREGGGGGKTGNVPFRRRGAGANGESPEFPIAPRGGGAQRRRAVDRAPTGTRSAPSPPRLCLFETLGRSSDRVRDALAAGEFDISAEIAVSVARTLDNVEDRAETERSERP